MRAYSQDVRQRILQAVDQGKPRAEIIKTFAVSRSTIKPYLKLRRETGDVKPKARRREEAMSEMEQTKASQQGRSIASEEAEDRGRLTELRQNLLGTAMK